MIGLGGGSLAKWCYESLPRTHLTVIEINQKVIDLRSHFQIPPDDKRLSVVLGDGAAYVQHTVERPDVLLVDGYHLDGLPARETSTQQFYDDCFRTLAENGILVANLDGARFEWIHRIYRSFAGRVLIVTPKDGHNRIVFGFKGRACPAESYTIEELTRIFPLEITGVGSAFAAIIDSDFGLPRRSAVRKLLDVCVLGLFCFYIVLRKLINSGLFQS
jgi:spermidine synthase